MQEEEGRICGSPPEVLRSTWARKPEDKKEHGYRKGGVRLLHAKRKKEAPRTIVAVLPEGWLVPPKVGRDFAETSASATATVQSDYNEPGAFTYISSFNPRNSPVR